MDEPPLPAAGGQGSGRRWGDPVPIRGLLLDRARAWGLDHPLQIAEVFGSWADIVGAQVAARCEPASLGRGVLKVWAANPAWANELRYLAPEVIRRVNSSLGGPVVKELKVALRPAGGKAPAPGGQGRERGVGAGADRARRGSAPRGPAPRPQLPAPDPTTPSAGEVQAASAGIGDADLAAAVQRAFLASRTRRNGGGESK